MVTWAEILWARKCTACGSTFKPAEFGLDRAFCPTCTATLPDRLALHLDRAMHGSWFLAYWRLACRELRIRMPEAVQQYQTVWNREWNQRQAAVRRTERKRISPRSQMRTGAKAAASANV
jgi:hypothetical protein